MYENTKLVIISILPILCVCEKVENKFASHAENNQHDIRSPSRNRTLRIRLVLL